jgi:hypothetical protein
MTDDRIQRALRPRACPWRRASPNGWVAVGDELTEGADARDRQSIRSRRAEPTDWGGPRIGRRRQRGVPVGGTIAVWSRRPRCRRRTSTLSSPGARAARIRCDRGRSGPKVDTVEVGGRLIRTRFSATPSRSAGGFRTRMAATESWLFVQEPVSADRATYAPTCPHGAPSKDVGDGSIDTLRDRAGFLDAIGLQRVPGGSLDGRRRRRHRRRRSGGRRKVASLTLISPAGFGPTSTPATSRLRGSHSVGS